MKGLTQIPTQKTLLTAYNKLQSGRLITEAECILFSQWSRFDPRLGEILVDYLLPRWLNFNPLGLRKENLASIWPQALAVILEHVKNAQPHHPELFVHFYKICVDSILPAPYQSFSIGLFKAGGLQLFSQAQRSHPFFKKWGYYEGAPLYSKNRNQRSATHLDRETRKRILAELLREKKSLKVKDYLEACRYAIHPRQAERDLKTFFNLKARGATRSRVYSR